MNEEKTIESSKSSDNSANIDQEQGLPENQHKESKPLDEKRKSSKTGKSARKKARSRSRSQNLVTGLLRPNPRDGDRFRWVFILSVVAHLVIVLGVSFVLPSQADSRSIAPPLRITLVTEQSDSPPELANSLAQFDSTGEEEDSGAPLLPTSGGQPQQKQAERERKLVAEQANAIFNPDQPEEKTDPTLQNLNRDSLRAAIDIAYLNAQAKPRERFVSANARASEIAPYLENWRLLVERVGNLNYPDAAKRAKIEGNLVMDVTVNSDGSVVGIKILRSSGHKILDDGAERIVHIAAPFNPFSEEMKRDYDTLHIIRTWQFSQNTIRDVTR